MPPTIRVRLPTSIKAIRTVQEGLPAQVILISVKLTSKLTTVYLVSHHSLLGLPSVWRPSLPFYWINVLINFQFPALYFNTVDSAGILRHHSLTPHLPDHPFSISIGESLISFQILNFEVSKVQGLKKLNESIYCLHSLLNSGGSNHLTSQKNCVSHSVTIDSHLKMIPVLEPGQQGVFL